MTDTQPPTPDLDTIQARADAATAGPWGYFNGDDYADIAADYQQTGRGSYTCRQQVARIEADSYFDDPEHGDADEDDAADQMRADAEFIVHARTDVPALLAYARHLEARVTSLEAERDGWAEAGRNKSRILATRVAELEQQLAQAENTNARTLANELVTNKPQAECGAPHPVAADTHCERQPGHDGGHAAIANAWPIAQWPFAPVPARDGR